MKQQQQLSDMFFFRVRCTLYLRVASVSTVKIYNFICSSLVCFRQTKMTNAHERMHAIRCGEREKFISHYVLIISDISENFYSISTKLTGG